MLTSDIARRQFDRRDRFIRGIFSVRM